jgi:signal transduction histidine kinase
VSGGAATTSVLVRFSRLAAAATSPAAILPILADSAIDHLGADAAAVLQLDEQGAIARVVASRELPAELASWQVEADAIGPELGQALLAACAGRFAHAHTMLLVSGGGLYGVLVLMCHTAREITVEQLALAEGLADLAAIAISKAVQYDALERSLAELRSARDALALAEKLRALGQMAAGVSHDLKNILNPISLQVQLLKRRLDKGREALEAVVAQIEEALRFGVATVEQLRDFGRMEPERALEPVQLDRVVASALELVAPRLRQHPAVALRDQLGQPPEVLVRAPELLNAIVNLIGNALDAVGERGAIVVRSGASDGGGWVQVEDNGPGMPPEIERRVFEPFFTTKSEGTGLGLPMVYAFVQRYGGKVTLETAPGRGTRFRLWFPAA